MLGKKLTEAREYISLYDPALRAATAMERAKYHVTRDIADLGDWKVWPSQPTIFKIKPLEPGYGHLADEMSYMARRQLFMLHVDDIKNFDDGKGKFTWEDINDCRSLKSEDVARFGDDIVDEIATFIVEAANADTSPFSSRPGYQDFLKMSNTMHALNAHTAAAAKEKSSD